MFVELPRRETLSILAADAQFVSVCLCFSVAMPSPAQNARDKMLTMNKIKIKILDNSRVKQLPLCSMPNKYSLIGSIL